MMFGEFRTVNVPADPLQDEKVAPDGAVAFPAVNFQKLVLTRTDPTIDFEWKGASPDPSVPADAFSVRWTGQVKPRYSETYTFHAMADDGVRMWVNGQLVIDDWHVHPATESRGSMALAAGQKYDVKGNARPRWVVQDLKPAS